MLLVLVGLAAALAALALYLRVERQGAAGLPLALLRAVAWGTVAALLVNPALRHLAAPGPVVLLDASLSMTDPASQGDARWRAALDSVQSICGSRCAGRVIAFGAEPRLWSGGGRPQAPTSLLLPALREAAARGGPLVVVTDGEVDDAGSLPADLLHAARIVTLPRRSGPDAGVAALDLPAALRAGDTARASVDVVARGAASGDTALLELSEQGRVVARARIPLGKGGVTRRELAFVPANPAGDRDIRRYEARLTGFAGDGEPRDDARRTAAVVSRGPAIALLSDSPDWDFRWLSQTLTATSGVPVLGWVRTSAGGGWREVRTLKPASDQDIRAQLSRATLAVLHGTPQGIAALQPLAHGAVLTWPAMNAAATPGDWYVTAAPSSPVGGVLAGASADSLPPLEALAVPGDSAQWTGLTAQQGRRGPARPVIQGLTRGGRRQVRVLGTGLWRWASRGGAAAEAYRTLFAATADWLLEQRGSAPEGLLALRDSLARGASEFLPRESALRPQPGDPKAAAGEPIPLRHAEWVYFIAMGALVLEWIARRRRGLR